MRRKLVYSLGIAFIIVATLRAMTPLPKLFMLGIAIVAFVYSLQDVVKKGRQRISEGRASMVNKILYWIYDFLERALPYTIFPVPILVCFYLFAKEIPGERADQLIDIFSLFALGFSIVSLSWDREDKTTS